MGPIGRRKVLTIMSAGLLAPSVVATAVAQSSVPDSIAGLQGQLAILLAAAREKNETKLRSLIAALKLPKPEAWFRNVFGAEAGARLTSEWAALMGGFDDSLKRMFASIVEKGRSEIQVLRFERADDPKAVGNQRDALSVMKSPQGLYSARFVKPGEQFGMHLYSFAHSEGVFRLVGKLAAAKSA